MDFETLDFGGGEYLGILVGAIAYFALGALWYTVLFGERWRAATGRTREEFPNASPAWMALSFLAGIVTTAVVAALYTWSAGDGIGDGILAGAVIGIGVVAMEFLKNVVYNFDTQQRPWPLYAINAGYAVVGLVLAGAIYSLFA
jgi:hypothetical protein